jgi:hypothetical protein
VGKKTARRAAQEDKQWRPGAWAPLGGGGCRCSTRDARTRALRLGHDGLQSGGRGAELGRGRALGRARNRGMDWELGHASRGPRRGENGAGPSEGGEEREKGAGWAGRMGQERGERADFLSHFSFSFSFSIISV